MHKLSRKEGDEKKSELMFGLGECLKRREVVDLHSSDYTSGRNYRQVVKVDSQSRAESQNATRTADAGENGQTNSR
jgi:hypothetical protein